MCNCNMLLCFLYLFAILNLPLTLQSLGDKAAFMATDMKKLKAQYPHLFVDYHPAKFAYSDPSFIYYYKWQNSKGKYITIGFKIKIKREGYEYLGKKKFNPFPYIDVEFIQGFKTRIYTSCGRKPMKPLFTADGRHINK